MKNSLQLLALGLVLFLGACSVSPDAFLESVKGKTMYTDVAMTEEFGVFSADGKDFAGAKFDKMLDDTTASYIQTSGTISTTASIQTTDGKKGTYSVTAVTIDGKDQPIPDAAKNTPIYLQVAPK